VLPRAALALLLVASFTSVLHAQSTNASISGRVTDPSKAVIVDAKVAAINADTNVGYDGATNASGDYYLTNLPPGSYRIEVEKTGFKKLIKPDVILHVQDALAIDFEMTLGSAAESVTVEAGAPMVNTESAAVSTVIDRTFVENIPLNGRSFQSLITLTPGVVLTKASSSSPGQFSVNGQRSDANYFMVDGVSANVGVQPGTGLGVLGAGAAPALSAGGGTNSLVSVDALQEFRIQTSSYAPEFGRTPGGQISIVTRSGTNQFHGTLFEYFRNDVLDSADYFVKRNGLTKPKERQNDFGGVFGGPIQRDHTFVFVSYEGLRLVQPKSAVTEVPSVASRTAASPALSPIFAAFPLPNGPNTANGLAQYSASYSDPSSLNAVSIRVDRVIGTKLTIFGRYNYAPSEASSRLGSFAIASVNTIGILQNNLQTLTGGATWAVNSKLSDELRVNWSRNVGSNFQMIDNFGGAVLLPMATLHPAFAPPENSYQVSLSGVDALFADGPNAANIERQVNIVDSVLLTKGRHQLKFGIDYRRLFPSYDPLKYVQAFTFSGATGALSGTASSLLVNGFATSDSSPHATNFSAFAQDTWTANSRLTLAYGVRWEVNPPPVLSGTTAALSLTSADPATVALAAPGTPMYHTTYNNFAPRFGAAYQLREATTWSMVLRGGAGIFYDLGNDTAMDNFTSFPFVARRNLSNVPFPVDPAFLTPPTVAPGAPADFLTAADPNLKLPYAAEWNVAVEQALGAASTISASYLGARGQRLLREERFLNPSPQFVNLTLLTNHGHSRYDAMQVEYDRRLSRGLQAVASYTLAHSVDNVSNDTIPALPAVRVDPEVDWGPSDFDVRHALSGALTYAVPTPPLGPVWRAMLGGWSVDAVITARSALPVNVVTGTRAFGVPSVLRPDVVPGLPFYVDDPADPGGRIFNKEAFTPPPLDSSGNPLRQGTLGRNALRSFAMSQLDFAIGRDFKLAEHLNLQVRAEAFNLFNQVNFGLPTSTLSSGLFGQPTQTLASNLGAGGVAGGGFSPLYQTGGPRSIQLALKFQF